MHVPVVLLTEGLKKEKSKPPKTEPDMKTFSLEKVNDYLVL